MEEGHNDSLYHTQTIQFTHSSNATAELAPTTTDRQSLLPKQWFGGGVRSRYESLGVATTHTGSTGRL